MQAYLLIFLAMVIAANLTAGVFHDKPSTRVFTLLWTVPSYVACFFYVWSH